MAPAASDAPAVSCNEPRGVDSGKLSVEPLELGIIVWKRLQVKEEVTEMSQEQRTGLAPT